MPQITRKELAEVIGSKTLQIKDRQQLANSIAAYLASDLKTKSINLDSLMRDVMQYRLEHGIVEAVAVSAHELDDRVISDIKSLLKEHFPDAKSVLVDQKIDASLVGGVRIELPQENLDLSVRSKLNLFKRLASLERK